MITINAHDYAQSAKALFLYDYEAERMAQMLADDRDPFNLRADRLAGCRSSDVIACAIARIQVDRQSEARYFLPALHALQLALWFEASTDQPA